MAEFDAEGHEDEESEDLRCEAGDDKVVACLYTLVVGEGDGGDDCTTA